MIARRGNIQNDEFVRAFDVIACRERGRISGIAQIHKLQRL